MIKARNMVARLMNASSYPKNMVTIIKEIKEDLSNVEFVKFQINTGDGWHDANYIKFKD